MPIGSNGKETKFYNGKKIVIKPKQPIEIQKKIDSKSMSLPGDIKDLRSSFDPDKIFKENIKEYSDAFGRDTFTTFSKLRNADKERDKQRLYQIYRDMYTQTFIKNSLDIIKNETAQKNDEGNLISIISDDQDIIDYGNELFFDILDINYELKSIILETIQMGDNYYEIVLDDYKNPKSIVHLECLPQERMTIIQQNGRLKFYVYAEEDLEFSKGKNNIDPWNFVGVDEKQRKYTVYMPWQIVHFKIKDRESHPYGRSLLRAGVKDYRRLALLEDAMLVYRVSRAPERRIFYIDVGQLNSVDAKIFLNKIKNTFKKEPIIDEEGRLSERANVMSLLEDFYIPVRDGSQGTRIEPLAAGQQLNEIKDMLYFKDKILRLLNIPLPYIGGSPDQNSGEINKSLSNIDIKFANYIEEIQSYIVKGLNKIMALQLILLKFKSTNIINFKIQLTPPSNLSELIKLETLNSKIATASALKATQMFSDETIYSKIFKLSKKEIYVEQVKLASQMKKMQTQQAAGMEGGGELGGAPPSMPTDLGAPEVGGGAIQQGTNNIGGEGGVTPPGPEIAGYDPEIYSLGMSMINENYEEVVLNRLSKKFGNNFLPSNKKDIIEFIKESKTLREMLKKEEKKKRKVKNNFRSMVLLGEFNGIDFKDKTLKHFKNSKENIISLKDKE